jgi:hypothetical protein
MSHVATIDLIVRDLESLRQAAEDLGLTFNENQKTYRWYGRHVGDYPMPEGMTADQLGKCEHSIGRKDGKGYEVGVIKTDAGAYRLIYDFYGRGGVAIEEHVGKGCGTLKQAYAARVATKQARAQGFHVRRYVSSDGTVKLSLTK